MSFQLDSPEQVADMKLRGELQIKLQNAIRRSAPKSEIAAIEQEIQRLNIRIASYPTGRKK